jgi:hypothetical protein
LPRAVAEDGVVLRVPEGDDGEGEPAVVRETAVVPADRVRSQSFHLAESEAQLPELHLGNHHLHLVVPCHPRSRTLLVLSYASAALHLILVMLIEEEGEGFARESLVVEDPPP